MLRKINRLLPVCLMLALVVTVAACGRGNNDPEPTPGGTPQQTATPAPAPTPQLQETVIDPVEPELNLVIVPPASADPVSGPNVGPRTASGFQPLSTLPADTVGEITILAGGDHGLFRDIVNNPPEFTSDNWGALLVNYTAAKAFNELYPNVIFNVMSVNYYKNTDEVTFSQGLLNSQAQWGILPDIWETHSLVLHVLQGEVSDLSRYRNEASFGVFNPALMDMMNYNGAQMGLPAWFGSWATTINIDLAESLNIPVPPLNWNYDQYVDFISQADMVNVIGDIQTIGSWLGIGARDIAWSATHNGYVNFDTPEVRRLIDLEHRTGAFTVYPSNWNVQSVETLLNEYWWWAPYMFASDVLLANSWGGWDYGNHANPGGGNAWALYMPGRWDMWPVPGSGEMGPSLSTVFDPVVIRNFTGQANADLQLDLTYAFAAFLYGSVEGTRARHVEGVYVTNEEGERVFYTSVSDSWPVVRAPYFDQHMEIWYESQSDLFRTLPGFQNILRLLAEGQIWNMDARTFPDEFVRDGQIVNAFADWNDRMEESVAGVPFSDPAWPDRVKARLAEWTETTNHGLQLANQAIRDAMARFYGYEFRYE
ncbi:MAG: hypothetical protein FWD90_07430 [Defluviitaleaceae bacterium]|nr:hypothetical protein [Defluviitaleaceae bacterium]